ncbi:MAG: FAD-dependent monooxygenase, partial [Actinomycetota bacterium]|nr:FAD-dependent monooxygenase [Actinomycetota bacterium]
MSLPQLGRLFCCTHKAHHDLSPWIEVEYVVPSTAEQEEPSELDRSTQPLDTQVLIVGAGPTGLLLAGQLRRRGVDCVLVDAYDAPLAWDRATVVHPRSLQIFESLGLVDQFLQAAVHIRGARFHSAGRMLGMLDFGANPTRYPFDLGVSEETTERILTGYLDSVGGKVIRSTRLVDLAQEGDRVIVTLETGGEHRVITVAWVVGCDGYRSTVRNVSGIAYEGGVPDEPWAVFDAGIDGWNADFDVTSAHFDDPLVILTPLPGQRFRVYLRPESRTTDLEATARDVLDRYAPGVTFTGVQNRSRFLCHARVAERFRSGRVLLAGDAAHSCSPTEGHGMNTGLQDAYNLGWKLAHVCRGEAGDVLLDSYEAERRPVAVRIVESGAVADAAQARLDAAKRSARDAQLTATFADPDAIQSEAAAAAEVDRDYTGSAVIFGTPQEHLTGPAAGRLLPFTGLVKLPDGDARPMHELAHRAGHTVFVLGGPGTAASEVAAVLDQLRSVVGGGYVET